MSNKIIVALDNMPPKAALTLAKKLAGLVWGFKVNDLLLHCGVSIITELKKHGSVFADPKLHDIPNTVANGVRKLEEAGADFITVHASGGETMLKAAKETSQNAKILAVTALTSLSTKETQIIYQKNVEETVIAFASLAASAGIDGIVCSPKELSLLFEETSCRPLVKVTPGVRPSWHIQKDDQTRTLTPQKALEKGADFLVIGRPITHHENPFQAVELLAQELVSQ